MITAIKKLLGAKATPVTPNPYTPPAEAEKVREAKRNIRKSELFQRSLESAEYAISLPEGYFKEVLAQKAVTEYYFKPVFMPGSVRKLPTSERPLFGLMDGCHSSIDEDIRDALWADDRYRTAVAHVLRNQDPAEVLTAGNRALTHGYLEPVARTLLRAVAEDLVGRKMDWNFEEKIWKIKEIRDGSK